MDAAIESSRPFIDGNPSPEAAAAVLYTQAWVNDKRGKPDEALPVWEKLATDYPKSQYGAQAIMRVADARMSAGKFDEAREKYAAILAGPPAAIPNVAETRFKLGSALYNLDKPAEAAAEFDAAAGLKDAGPYSAESLYWAG